MKPILSVLGVWIVSNNYWMLTSSAAAPEGVASSPTTTEEGFTRIDPFASNLTASSSCLSHESCSECLLAANWCHWCEHSQSCHQKGSLYGCLYGASSCEPPHKKNDTDPTGCSMHMNCSECALASHLCHWCSHDNACHAIGSYYGCVSGVDCYSNDRCMRNHSQPLDEIVFTQIGFVPLVAVLTMALVMLCCASLCFCVAGGVKGAYDDLHFMAAASVAPDYAEDYERPPRSILAAQQTETSVLIESSDPLPETDEAEGEVDEHAGDPEADANDDAENAELAANETDDPISLLEETGSITRPLLDVQQPLNLPRRSLRPRRSRHMQRLFNLCTTFYVCMVVTIGCMTFGAIRYFPKAPVYNICNDAVAWKSIIDSLASLKPTANFQILGSLSNPNHMDVRLAEGRGSFYHDGAFVGTFDIPPFEATAMSVSDFLIIAHLAPEKWEALSLTAEYYRGKLVLHVDTSVTVQVPAFFNYSFHADVKDFVVNVNELSDRSLCACPNWNDAKNNSRVYLPEIDFTASL